MPIFRYSALNKNGKKIKGKMEAPSEGRLIGILKDSGYYPLEINKESILQKDIEIHIGNPVKTKDLSIFCRQLASILSAGISVMIAIDILKEQTENKYLSKVLVNVSEKLEQGVPLSEALNSNKKSFPNILIRMVEAGEYSGNLELTFERMAEHFEKEYKLKQSVQRALTYPIVISIISVLVVIGLVVFVVPTFVNMFKGIGMELPMSTKMLLAISDFVKAKWYIVIGVIVLVISSTKRFYNSEAGKLLFARIKLKTPIWGKLNTKIASSRFTRTLSTLLAAGIPLITCMEIVAKIIDNHVIEKGLLSVKEQVSKGVPVSKPLSEMNIFPPMVVHMVKIGEDTGTIESTLTKVADFYDGEVETAVTQMTTLIEPIIIVFMAIVVGFIVLSIVQPMFQMYQGISNL